MTVGLRLRYMLGSDLVLGVADRYGTTFLADMGNGPTVFHLGAAPWYSAGARLSWVPLVFSRSTRALHSPASAAVLQPRRLSRAVTGHIY